VARLPRHVVRLMQTLRDELATHLLEVLSLPALRFVAGGESTDAKDRRSSLCFRWSVQSLARSVLGRTEMACDVAQRARDCAFHQGRVLNTMILKMAEVLSLPALRFVAGGK